MYQFSKRVNAHIGDGSIIILSSFLMKIKLSSQLSWNQNGTTVAGNASGISGSSLSELNRPVGISITDNDILYISDQFNHRVVVIDLSRTTNTFAIGSEQGSALGRFKQPIDVFVFNSSLYVTDEHNNRIQNMRLDGSNLTTAYNTTSLGQPLYLYIDSYENVYVTSRTTHSVFVFRPNSTNGTRVAGNGTQGSTNEQLDWPYGIFVSDNGTIYVADRNNHRIMKWLAGASSGIRVAGDGTFGYNLTQVNSPTNVIVDEDEFIYITEAIGSRITRWAPNSSYGTCIVACSGTTGTGPNQLNQPHSLGFDSFGSLYVSEWSNNRVQKFELLNYPVPYNQPNLDSNATWSQCGVTFIDKTTFRSFARAFFIDSNNTLYLVDYVSSRILIWHDHITYPSRELSATLFEYTGLFVTLNGDIFFQNGNQTGRIDKFSSNSNISQLVTMFSGNCYSLFVDIRDTLYCSLHEEHRVVTASLSDNNRSAVTIAGTSSGGPQSDQLWYPWGIFVDISFSLYVADEVNDRIQLFRRGERSGTTVAGKNIPNGLTLNKPTDVVLDGNGFLYIADNKNNRIIRIGDGDFECITGCAKIGESASNQLNLAYSLRLDSVGNLYVADEANRRIQQFSVSSNSCQTSSFVTTALTSTHPDNSTSLFWNAHSCGINTSYIGSYCNISGNICHVQNPCLHTGNCTSLNNNQDYYCSCPLGFSGKRCQVDERPCKPSRCLNNGEFSSSSE
ncbi:unnamed protein product [Adineta ricciae]|uniref:EGF-like domain-containing protein n=1 Tax=Adineta ricciae TaxID=249248 RepID=A0A814ZUZ8_ADIRI|nr:unnamed protein product [Adineta ricciae]